MAWIYLLIASVFEIAWTFSLKFMDIKKIRALHWAGIFNRRENWLVLVPFMGYIVFGIGNIFFFSLSMKQIPATTALAVWMGVTLIGVKLVDVSLFSDTFDLLQLLYLALILIGIIGLKRG